MSLTSAGGAHRLRLRVGRRQVQATLAGANAGPVRLKARRARAAIFGVRISPTGSVIGTAAGGGVLGAQLSANGLAGALALPGRAPTAFQAPDFATTPLFVDGVATSLPLDRLGESMAGDWRWIVTSRGFIGGGTQTVTVPDNVPDVSTLGKRGFLSGPASSRTMTPEPHHWHAFTDVRLDVLTWLQRSRDRCVCSGPDVVRHVERVGAVTFRRARPLVVRPAWPPGCRPD